MRVLREGEKRPQMFLEDFEELARSAPETVQLEFIAGRLEVRPVPDREHLTALMKITDAFRHARPELDLHLSRRVKVGGHAFGRAWLEGALAPTGYFVDGEEWADPSGILMAVTVTMSTDRRDPVALREAYAWAEIPVFLVVDRTDQSAVVFFDPVEGRYRSATMCAFGDVLRLPRPVGVDLRTAAFERLEEGPTGPVRVTTEIAAQTLADLRHAHGGGTDEELVRRAVIEAAWRSGRSEAAATPGEEQT